MVETSLLRSSSKMMAFATKAVHDMYGALKENGDYTSIINERHFNRLRRWTEDAKHKGAGVIELNPAGEDFTSPDLHRLGGDHNGVMRLTLKLVHQV